MTFPNNWPNFIHILLNGVNIIGYIKENIKKNKKKKKVNMNFFKSNIMI